MIVLRVLPGNTDLTHIFNISVHVLYDDSKAVVAPKEHFRNSWSFQSIVEE